MIRVQQRIQSFEGLAETPASHSRVNLRKAAASVWAEDWGVPLGSLQPAIPNVNPFWIADVLHIMQSKTSAHLAELRLLLCFRTNLSVTCCCNTVIDSWLVLPKSVYAAQGGRELTV